MYKILWVSALLLCIGTASAQYRDRDSSLLKAGKLFEQAGQNKKRAAVYAAFGAVGFFGFRSAYEPGRSSALAPLMLFMGLASEVGAFVTYSTSSRQKKWAALIYHGKK